MSLDQATRDLYAAFAKYPKPRQMQASPARSDAAKISWPAMERTPLNQLSGDDLYTFGRYALSEWGTVNDFKHFLPRMLELAANGDERIPSDSITQKLAEAYWRQWPENEQKALRDFGLAWWQTALEPPEADLHATLSIIGQYLDDEASVRAMMEFWRPDFSNAHLDLLARFVLQEHAALRAQPPTLSTGLKPMAEPMTRWIAEQLEAFEDGIMYNPDAPQHWHQAKQIVQMMHANLSF